MPELPPTKPAVPARQTKPIPVAQPKIEEALLQLKEKYSIVLVTNNTKQAARASDRTAFFLMGELIECGPTVQLFTNPAHHRTSDYITGHFG